MQKKDLGLPHYDAATARQRRDGMCWRDEDEIYNGGSAFKLTCRDQRGVIVTMIADNYYGYCKKEVKTQISYAANLFGLCEEEHAGGAIAFPAYVLGQEFYAGPHRSHQDTSSSKTPCACWAIAWSSSPKRYAVDRNIPNIFYVPENADFSVREAACDGRCNGRRTQSSRLRGGEVYVLPWGTKIRLEKQPGGTAWRLIAFARRRHPLPQALHRFRRRQVGDLQIDRRHHPQAPCSSAISPRHGPGGRDSWQGFLAASIKKPPASDRAERPILSPERSLGSVIKLLTPSPEYTDEHNEWLRKLPQTIRQLSVTVKRYYRPEWGENWHEYFTVDRINGSLGHELKYRRPEAGRQLSARRLRSRRLLADLQAAAGLPSRRQSAGGRRHHRLCGGAAGEPPAFRSEVSESQRQAGGELRDAAVPAPRRRHSSRLRRSRRRPISPRPGLSSRTSSRSPSTQAQAMVDHVVEFDQYTEPMKQLLRVSSANPTAAYVVSSAHPRMVDGRPSKNPRYLQKRPDLVDPREAHLAEMGTRLNRGIPSDAARAFPGQCGAGRPPQQSARSQDRYAAARRLQPDPLSGTARAVHGFHLQPDRQVALHHRLRQRRRADQRSVQRPAPVVDVNNALVSAIVTGYAGFTTAAGYIGPKYRVDHDNSMLVPEMWCRMRVPRARPRIPDRQRLSRKGGGSRIPRPHGARQPPGLPHHAASSRTAFSAAFSRCPQPSSPKSF